MLRHIDIWRAIDDLALAHGLTPSGLARKAGLDPTTFNKSKRTTRGGHPRWPSTESISKILRATGASLREFNDLVIGDPDGQPISKVPMTSIKRAENPALFDEAGRPAGEGWDDVAFLDAGRSAAFALEVSGDEHAPVYRDGDVLVVAPGAPVRPGDRVLVRAKSGDLLIRQLIERHGHGAKLAGVRDGEDPKTWVADDIAWMHRIVWVRQ